MAKLSEEKEDDEDAIPQLKFHFVSVLQLQLNKKSGGC